MTTLLFSLVFVYSGVSYTLYTNLDVYQCSAKSLFERNAIKEVLAKHPEMKMSVSCVQQPNRLGS